MDAESEPRNDTLPYFPRTGQVHAYFVLTRNFSRPLWHLTCRNLGEGAGERLIKHFLPRGKNNRKKNSAGIPATYYRLLHNTTTCYTVLPSTTQYYGALHRATA